MTTTLREAGYRQGTRAVIPEGDGQKIKVRLMGWEPGSTVIEGSSGDYPVAAAVRDFPLSFPKGTRMRANHDGMCEAGGDIRRIMAKTTSAPWEEADGMYSWARVKEGEPSDFIRQFADAIGTSVSVGVELEQTPKRDEDGEIVRDENDQPIMVNKMSERGVPVVKRFLSMQESPYNAVDFVEAPGADGAIVELAVEAAKNIYEHMTLREASTFALDLAGKREKTSEATPPRDTKKENSMEPDEVQAVVEAAATLAVQRYAEAQAPAAPEQPSLSALAEAVVTAGLTEAGRAEVYARIERGESLESAIASESAREAAIESEVQRRVAEALESQSLERAFDFGFTTDDKHGAPLGTESSKVDSKAIEAAFEAVED
jgi:hypothetical protein